MAFARSGLLLAALACHPRPAPVDVPDPSTLPDLSGPDLRDRLRDTLRRQGLIEHDGWWDRVEQLPLVAAEVAVTESSLSIELVMAIPAWARAEPDRVVLRALGAGERLQTGATVHRARLAGRSAHAEIRGTVIELVPSTGLPEGSIVLELDLAQEIPDASIPLGHADQRNMEDFGLFGAWPSHDLISLAWVLPQLERAWEGGWDDRPLPTNGEHLAPLLHDVDLRVTAPPDLQVVGSGVSVGMELEAGRRRHRFAAPLVRETSLVLGRSLQTATVKTGPTQLRIHGAPRDGVDPDALRGLAADAAWGWQRLTDSFGAVPWREIDVVLSPARTALGSEFTGLALLHVVPEKDEPSEVLAHELAHQWWYAAVGNDARQEPWVDEALTTWTGAWLIGLRRGDEARMAVFDLGGDHEGPDGDLPGAAYTLDDYADAVYARGASWYEALYQRVGEDRLLGALRSWHERRGGTMATRRQLEEHLLELAPSR